MARSLDYTRNSFTLPFACSTSSPPDTTTNPLGSAANPITLYPIMRAEAQADGTARPMLLLVDRWQDDATNDPIVRWYPNYAPGVPGASYGIWDNGICAASNPGYTGRIYLDTAQAFDADDFLVTSTDGSYKVGLVEIENTQLAAASLYLAPKQTIDEDQQLVAEKDVAIGQVIRGYTGTGRRSVGDIVHYTGGGKGDYDTAEWATRKCFGQIMIPRGYWTDSTSYQQFWGDQFFWYINPRALSDFLQGGIDTTVIEPTIVVSGDEGSEVRVTNTNSGNTWTYTIPAGGIANPTLITDSSGTYSGALEYTSSSDIYKFEVKGPTAGGEMILWTASLWEQ